MLEINKIKNDPDGVVERLKKRGINLLNIIIKKIQNKVLQLRQLPQ